MYLLHYFCVNGENQAVEKKLIKQDTIIYGGIYLILMLVT